MTITNRHRPGLDRLDHDRRSVHTEQDGVNYTTLVPSRGYTFNPVTGNTASATFTANAGWPAGQLSELQVFQG
ncbi:hypothetical protein [Streptacidiphilus pinicola]|uniref:hypothetical protein n=1 Tax=Streptacidiphilus pinicola TaxID=2219663 RepID=UPI001057F18C|nr:hypothetical protein [Streptacidiphilus pinicola]